MVNNDHISELFLAADTVEGNGHSVPGLDAATLPQVLRSAGCPGV
ncbi:hypothetical protein ABVN23_21535 [Pseudomonas fluorescens]